MWTFLQGSRMLDIFEYGGCKIALVAILNAEM